MPKLNKNLDELVLHYCAKLDTDPVPLKSPTTKLDNEPEAMVVATDRNQLIKLPKGLIKSEYPVNPDYPFKGVDAIHDKHEGAQILDLPLEAIWSALIQVPDDAEDENMLEYGEAMFVGLAKRAFNPNYILNAAYVAKLLDEEDLLLSIGNAPSVTSIMITLPNSEVNIYIESYYYPAKESIIIPILEP